MFGSRVDDLLRKKPKNADKRYGDVITGVYGTLEYTQQTFAPAV